MSDDYEGLMSLRGEGDDLARQHGFDSWDELVEMANQVFLDCKKEGMDDEDALAGVVEEMEAPEQVIREALGLEEDE